MPSLLRRLSDNQPQVEEDNDETEGKNSWLLDELKMLFSSRSRFPDIEAIPLVNSSIVNYGIDESLLLITEDNERKTVIKQRIQTALQRFEPRLTHVTITARAENTSNITFAINAQHKQKPLTVELVWDNGIGKFYFNE